MLAVTQYILLERHIAPIAEYVTQPRRVSLDDAFDCRRTMFQVTLVPDAGGERIGIADEHGSAAACGRTFQLLLAFGNVHELGRFPAQLLQIIELRLALRSERTLHGELVDGVFT